jgi:glycosyltransferase involved in cell wall biosynthesis
MAACGEWFWPRGYLAEAREIEGVLRSDVTLAVHPDLSLLKLARLVGKTTAVCGNGWDSAEAADALSKEIRLPAELVARVDANRALWLYIGRGEDFVKGVDRLLPVLKSRPSLQLAAAPGSGFENASSVLQTGRIDSSQVRLLLERATGLLVASRYEGNSLVVLEALALGLPVISTRVGGVTAFPEGVQGLFVLESAEPSDFIRAIEAVEALDRSEAARRVRGERNRSLLPRWSDVAKSALQAVNAVRERRAKGGK